MACRIAELFFLISLLTIRGECGLVGPPGSVVGFVGRDCILPCRLQPAENVAERTVEWTRSRLDPSFVLIYRDGNMFYEHLDFQQRTDLSKAELQKGDMSLHFRNLKLSDAGTFICKLVMDQKSQPFVDVQLVVGAVSEPQISAQAFFPKLELRCEANNWYPQPELEWRNGEGQTIHKDYNISKQEDYFSISSRISVDITSSDNFTCLVRQKDIRETMEKIFIVPKDVAVLKYWYFYGDKILWILSLLVVLMAVVIVLMAVGKFGPQIHQRLTQGTAPQPGGHGGAHKDPSKPEDAHKNEGDL